MKILQCPNHEFEPFVYTTAGEFQSIIALKAYVLCIWISIVQCEQHKIVYRWNSVLYESVYHVLTACTCLAISANGSWLT